MRPFSPYKEQITSKEQAVNYTYNLAKTRESLIEIDDIAKKQINRWQEKIEEMKQWQEEVKTLLQEKEKYLLNVLIQYYVRSSLEASTPLETLKWIHLPDGHLKLTENTIHRGISDVANTSPLKQHESKTLLHAQKGEDVKDQWAKEVIEQLFVKLLEKKRWG